MSTGLVHDYLLVLRGAERTFAAIADCWPEAPVYTLLYDPDETAGRFDGREVHSSYLQRLGARQRGFRRLLPLYPRAAESLPVQDHDLLISSSSAFAHGIRQAPGATHVCYCHTPFRYVWHERQRGLAEAPRVLRPFLRRSLQRIHAWDLDASARVTHYIANSEITRERIARFWDRDAAVIHPPVDVDRFELAEPEDYLLVVTELVPHKRVDVALEAARRAARPIRVVGSGPDRERLEALHGDHAHFLGRVDDDELAGLYSRAAALVVPNVEEFGIAAVEAMAAGRPVVAPDAGGTRETVIDGETGVLVPPGDLDALAEALRVTDFDGFSPTRISAHAAGFSTASFRHRFTEHVRELSGAASPVLEAARAA
ncbi:MAG TPA: glycosyltransferase [Thermoleophilaceae bacterium]|nr:glycosyltransferase [Thermoleophilaceae bacterium]